MLRHSDYWMESVMTIIGTARGLMSPAKKNSSKSRDREMLRTMVLREN